MDKNTVLRQYYGHTEFRPGQEHLIDAILSGQDALGVMPTGGGKSLCYQIPALLLPGVTLVISPLISLMKDQVSALKAIGVPAAFINSSLNGEQLKTVYGRVRKGVYKIVYIAPERLDGEGFASLVRSLEIALVAIDEAHCVSQWGQDFRPSYLRIADFIRALPRRPVVAAFTATATAEVRGDIVQLLALQAPVCEITGFDRPNLFFDVQHPQNKLVTLLSLLEKRQGKSGIIYCATRASVEKLCGVLCEHGIAATRYHAGLEDYERQENQDNFQFDRKTVMVATNAFGMGIDKSNVGFVIHYNMPKSLEAYYQEAGRAGRDGSAADCILLYSAADITTAKFLIDNGGNESLSEEEQTLIRQRDYDRLNAMIEYCKSTDCLRGYLLDYFGQSHAERCENCGNCSGDYRHEDITQAAQMIFSCIVRVRERLGYFVGKTLIVQVLRGSKNQRIEQLQLEKLSTYGLMAQLSAGQVYAYLDCLTAEGYLRINPAHATLELTADASNVLFRGKDVLMPVRVDRMIEKSAVKKGKKASSGAAYEESGLFDVLRAVRSHAAQAEGVPAYIVFSNATLADMAAKAPRTMSEFRQVSGVGEVKAKRYGQIFLDAITEYEER